MFFIAILTVILLISSGVFCANEELCLEDDKHTNGCMKLCEKINETMGICHGTEGNLKCQCM
uniref:CSab-Iso-7 n=1 Tax=Isometroides vescus TaxID=1330405 RepID=T1DPA9_9SCOR